MPSKHIGIIVPYLSQGFVAALLDGVHATAHQHDAQVIVFEGTPEQIGTLALARDHIQGWILFLNSTGVETFRQTGAPVVAISAAGCEDMCPVVLPDNRGGIQALMQHLFAHGHEHIAFIGTMENADIQQRLAGYQAALAEHGLPFDANLVVDTQSYFEEHGRAAVQMLIDGGHAFTAVVAAGDFNAFGAIEALRAAGRQVPEDVAVVGFDDVPSAQFADPPLTTIRQKPEALGTMAVETLLRQIAGDSVAPGPIYVPTALIQRRSCGCDTTLALPLPDKAGLSGAGWQAYLLTQLVLLARHPLQIEPGATSAETWPGAVRLVAALAAILDGANAPANAAMEQPWREAVALTDNLDSLYAMIKLLELAGAQHLDATPAEDERRAQFATFLDQSRLAMMRARLDHEVIVTDVFDRMARAAQTLDAALLEEEASGGTHFAWLEHTAAEGACLGLWDTADEAGTATLTIADCYLRGDANGVAPGSRYRAEAFPPDELLDAPAAADTPTNMVVQMVSTAQHQWGVLALRLPTAMQITYDLHGLRPLAQRLGAILERQSLLHSLRQQQEILSEAYERERALADTIREIGCPIIPLRNHTLLVPLVGVLDSTRAGQIIEAVLDGIQRHHARVILLDITAVPLVDTQVAGSLLHTAYAAKLLGASVIMVGVRPEIAQSIVTLGLDLSQIVTYPTLATALSALDRRFSKL